MFKPLAIFALAIVFAIPSHALADQKITFGRFQSRAIFSASDAAQCPAPLVILIPGSGPNGPEEMMPGKVTADGKDHSLFGEFSEGLRRGHVGTLAVGKPGVDFFKSWKQQDRFYDEALYLGLGWQDLIDNLKDAVEFAKTLSCVDPRRIFILGHSEGTQVAVDFADQNPSFTRGLVLVGFAGENLATTVDWQLFKRPIGAWLAPDVDTDHDGFISKQEVTTWPEFQWDWTPNQDKVSFAEIEQAQRADANSQKRFQRASTAKIWQGVFNRAPIYSEAASLPIDLFVFTGALDVQTRPEEALRLENECIALQKQNCEVSLVPGLGHGMSAPKGPRKQKFVDATLGPVDESFKAILGVTAAKFFGIGMSF